LLILAVDVGDICQRNFSQCT